MRPVTAVLGLLATTALVAASNPVQVPLDDDDDEQKLKVPGENPLFYCGDTDDYILDIDNVDLSPNPPKAGQKLTINAQGKLSKKVRKGTKAAVSVKYGIIKILQQDIDLCDQADNVDLECPIDEGDVELEKVVELPKEIPPGKYNVVANVTNKAEDIVTCLKASITFKPGGLGGFNAPWEL